MMRRLIAAALALLLSSCAYADLEERVARLESAKAKNYMTLAAETGARRFWWTNSLTGASDSLDQITCGTSGALTDGDMALVGVVSGTTGNFYVYHYDSSGTHSTDSPGRIICNDTSTGGDGGAWYLCNVYVTAIVSNAADGYHYIDVSNTDHMDASVRAEGRCAYNKTDHTLECVGSDGSTLQVIDMTND